MAPNWSTHRCEAHDNVRFEKGLAISLPVEDASFDVALSVQVLEYVDDVATALAEIHRALRPGERVVIWDVDWSTVSWYTDDEARSVLCCKRGTSTSSILPCPVVCLGFSGPQALPT